MHGLLLGIARRGQQPVDHLFVGIRRLVVDEGRDLVGRRRQAGEIERDAADQRAPVGLGRGRQPFAAEAVVDEASIGLRSAPASRRAGTAGRCDRLIGPMAFVDRAFRDPAPDGVLLRRRQFLVRGLRAA